MRKLRDILSDEDGVSIVFACFAMVVLFVIGGIVIAYGYNNYSRAVEDKQVGSNYDAVSVVTKSLRDACTSSSVVGQTLPAPAASASTDLAFLGAAINSAAGATGSWSDVATVSGTDGAGQTRTYSVQVTCAKDTSASVASEEIYRFSVQGSDGDTARNDSTIMSFTTHVKVVTSGSGSSATTTRSIVKDTTSQIERVVR